MLELYTDATPNGLKISIGLEELGLAYKVHRIFLGGDQLKPEFTALNPNNKIPVLVDDGLVLTESGAILIYLAEPYAGVSIREISGQSSSRPQAPWHPLSGRAGQ